MITCHDYNGTDANFLCICLHITMLWWELQRVNRKKHLSKKRFPFVTVWVLERINPESSESSWKRRYERWRDANEKERKNHQNHHLLSYVISNLHDLFFLWKALGRMSKLLFSIYESDLLVKKHLTEYKKNAERHLLQKQHEFISWEQT